MNHQPGIGIGMVVSVELYHLPLIVYGKQADLTMAQAQLVSFIKNDEYD